MNLPATTPRRDRTRLPEKPEGKPILKLALLGVGLLLLLALAADLRRMPKRKLPGFVDPASELQAIARGMNGPRYADPEGLFSIVAPAGWTTFKPPDSRP